MRSGDLEMAVNYSILAGPHPRSLPSLTLRIVTS
jgi:hypothetical protein